MVGFFEDLFDFNEHKTINDIYVRILELEERLLELSEYEEYYSFGGNVEEALKVLRDFNYNHMEMLVEFESKLTQSEDVREREEESWLFRLGYSVRKKVRAETRRRALTKAIEERSKHDVISLIKYHIRSNQANPKMKGAIRKWDADIEWIEQNH